MKLFTSIIFIFLVGCNLNYSARTEVETEFEKHVENADLILYNGDYLHPTHAYLKSGEIIGLSFQANPECGKINRKYLIGKNKEVEKTIIQKDFFNENCGNPFDSIYVVDSNSNKVITYSNGTKNMQVNNGKISNKYSIDLNFYRNEIRKWQKHIE